MDDDTIGKSWHRPSQAHGPGSRAPAPATEPSLAAAQARIAAVDPAAYARSRNALDGAVTGLSPYITHGLVSLTEVLTGVQRRHALEVQHKLVFELGWRAYFRHVWQHRSEAIFDSLHEGPLPDAAYARELPADVRQACTGVPVVDQAVRTLYQTGMLHNHARMWLASYLVHVRKIHWRTGADWLYGHLLDGDLASNHLSWQWVAGTGSRKPYLFNAENVARYAPADWHSTGTVIDVSYEALDQLARQSQAVLPEGEGERPAPTEAAALLSAPPPDLEVQSPDASQVQGRDVWIVHPWSLGALPADLPPDALVIGLWLQDFHQAWPWSERRWRFVVARMAELGALMWWGDAAVVGQALAGARRVSCRAEPHLQAWLSRWADCLPEPALFPEVSPGCASFSAWWTRSTRGLASADDLLSAPRR
ncbi:deoxyribodipyrimidine photolyase [Paucibacter sp. DJ1R-11]|uniref:FAD-binding domain-containing protein n=1 Tax=Paucibacter sp. DJ1R-11 TaxID=2893556 RepID=UPI0021E3CB0F|nr:FAD-binding domain-containing protein [Paucibacter sp. DJ1R-11]MCV2363255.1 deoxyribodipyrimidine photolyase [Paucibacter sp. DJ1R-11]